MRLKVQIDDFLDFDYEGDDEKAGIGLFMKCFDIAIKRLVLSKTDEFQRKAVEPEHEPPKAEDIFNPIVTPEPDNVKAFDSEAAKGRKKKFNQDEIKDE